LACFSSLPSNGGIDILVLEHLWQCNQHFWISVENEHSAQPLVPGAPPYWTCSNTLSQFAGQQSRSGEGIVGLSGEVVGPGSHIVATRSANAHSACGSLSRLRTRYDCSFIVPPRPSGAPGRLSASPQRPIQGVELKYEYISWAHIVGDEDHCCLSPTVPSQLYGQAETQIPFVHRVLEFGSMAQRPSHPSGCIRMPWITLMSD
jgi:hypothetical protein